MLPGWLSTLHLLEEVPKGLLLILGLALSSILRFLAIRGA